MQLSDKADFLISQVSALLPGPRKGVDWNKNVAAIWRGHSFGGQLVSYDFMEELAFNELFCIDDQKAALDLNTRQFLAGLPANNALLWGVRGSGKSSLVHTLLNRYKDEGLRLIQADKQTLLQFFEIMEVVRDEPYRFIIFFDDLSFDANDTSYKALKSILEGSVFTSSPNVLIYATSNRRHLVPESMDDNQTVAVSEFEIHHGEAVEEKISLSDRFGLWLAFHTFNQDDYLTIVKHWIETIAQAQESVMTLDQPAREEALRWALKRGSRSGRTAQHFARHWVGMKLLQGTTCS